MNLLTPNKKSTIINNTTNIYPLGRGMLVIIDPRIENYQMLASGVLPGAKVVILESGEDGVRQVSRAIFDYPVSTLHIVCHGSPGSMQLGNTRLSLGSLAAYRAELERWGEAIGTGGILLYGCEVAAGDIGAAFVERLHELSGVGVAAAVGRVGCAELGGSWELGVKVGNVGDGLVFGEEVLVGYGGVFADITVDTPNDVIDPEDGEISLREAIIEATSNGDIEDTIILSPGTYTLSIQGVNENEGATGDLDLFVGGGGEIGFESASININGAGADNTIIDAESLGDRVFDVIGLGVSVNISDVTITNGSVNGDGGNGDGGGIRNTNGNVVVNNSVISNNNSFISFTPSQGARGGGIFNDSGNLTINNSTISGNDANDGGGINNSGIATITNSTISANNANVYSLTAGIYDGGNAGGINNSGTITLVNSTISGNSSAQTGGGIENAGYLTVTNTTITDNTATTGGGGVTSFDSQLEINNTIIAGNIDNGNEAPDVFGTINVGSNNLIGNPINNNADTLTNTITDVVDIDTVLGSLADNGGLTQTHALVENANNPAIDAGNNDAIPPGIEFDQRGNGFRRSVDGNGDGTPVVDIGAFEASQVILPSFAFTNTTYTINEDGTPEGDSIQIERSGDTSGSASVQVQLTDVTATGTPTTFTDTTLGTEDFDNTPITVTFPPNETLADVPVIINDDIASEPTEELNLNLVTDPTTGIIDDPATLQIIDNDNVNISIDDVEVNENAGTAEFTINLSPVSSQDVTVTYSTSNETAIAGEDYTDVSETITITAGQTDFPVIVPILNNDDNIDQQRETFNVILSTPINAVISDNIGVGTIIDDVAPVVPNINIDNVTVDEGDGNAIFTVTLDRPSNQTINLNYSTSDGTAETPNDYMGTTFGFASIEPGTLSTQITVLIVDDNEPNEGEERFNVNLTTASSGNIVDGQGIGTIIDNDVIETGRISGVKFQDDNQNGIRDFFGEIDSESGLGGFTIYLDTNENGILDDDEQQRVSADDGSYSFNNLPFRDYIVREVPRQGFLQTTTSEALAFSLTSEQPNRTVNIGNSFGFSGRKFNDLNGNGILDEGEPGLRDVTIYIDINNNEILDVESEPSTTTDAEGNYRFFTSDIQNGIYFVREVVPNGFQQTTEDPQITIDDGVLFGIEDTFNVNFGNQQQQPQGSISGTKFNDLNGDGFFGDEPGIEDVRIYLDQNRNEVFDQGEAFQFTDIDGNYRFENLTPGEYIVREVVPLNFRPTLAPQQPITITAAGEDIPDINFGNTINIAGISITQTEGSTNVTEDSTTDTYQIVLNSIPDGVVNIAIAPDNQIDLGAGPGIPITRSFDSRNALTPKIINVTAVDDDVAEGPHLGNITHSVTSIDDPNYNSQTVPFTVDGETSPFVVTANITDNERPAVSTSVTTTQAVEGGFTGVYSLVLTTQPTAPVTINFDTGEEIEPIAPIIFNPRNWNAERLITVTARDDFDIEGDHLGIINHFATSTDGNYNGINILPVTVDIKDNDTAGVSINPTDIEATEGGATGSYEVVLTTQPVAPVTINFDTGNQIQPIAPITFDQTNWNVGRPINVAAVDDFIVEGNHIGTISHIATSEDINYNGLEISQVSTNITDNDTAAVSIQPLTTDATEGGATGSYEVVLTTEPTFPVIIEFDTGNQIQSINSITFDQTNWNIPQPITVAALDDLIAENNHIGTISHQVITTDESYATVQVSPVRVDITDNETAAVSITPQETTATEDGGLGNYQIVLTTVPTADVTINLVPDNQVQTFPTSINFTPQNWNIPQPITVSAIDDDIPNEEQHIGRISHQAISNDPNYNNLTEISQVRVEITDNDAEIENPQVIINESDGNTTLTTEESDTYDIRLDRNPTTPVNITITPPLEINLGAGAGIPITRTFDEQNGITPQTVTVEAVENVTANFNIVHTASIDGLEFTVDETPTNVVTANVIELIQEFGSISGIKFQDDNGDGDRDPGEVGLPNFRIYLDVNQDNNFDPEEPNAITDNNGNYFITNIPPEEYPLREVQQPGFTQTTPELDVTVTVIANENIPNQNFGNAPPAIPGTLQFSSPSFSVDENTPTNNAIVTVTRTGGSDGVVSADIDITDGTANRGSDFGDPVPETISFADGVTQQTVSIPIIDDNSDENTETANLSLTNVTGGANIGQPATATLEIIDDDPPLIANPDTASITQGDSPITINVLANDQGNFPEIIAFDNLSQAGNNVTIDGINNQIIYSLAPGFTTTEPFTDTFNYTISNNPNTPNSTAPVSVVINPPPEFPGSISGITFNDINRNGSLDPGETGLPNVTVFLDTNQNDTPDSNEQQTITNEFGIYNFFDLSPDNYTVRTISPPDATLTTAAEISVPLSSSQNVNDTNFGYSFPNPGTLQFSNPTFSFTEGTPNATVTVIRTGGSDGVVSADINLTNGTASRGIDFGNPIPETIFFADGETEQTVSIPIFDDNSDENNETANLSLANVTGGANIGQPATATLEIIDNDDRIEPQPLSINTEVFGFEQFTNFARFSFIPVDTPQGPANLRFSSNAIALVSNNISGGEGRFNVNPNINNTVIAYDTGNAIRIDLDDIINQVGEIESGNLLFDYASPNRSHTVTFLDENNQQLEERFLPQTSSGQFLNDFSNFNSTNIPIPEDTQFIDIGSEATELGIDNLQLTLQTEGILTESNIDSFF